VRLDLRVVGIRGREKLDGSRRPLRGDSRRHAACGERALRGSVRIPTERELGDERQRRRLRQLARPSDEALLHDEPGDADVEARPEALLVDAWDVAADEQPDGLRVARMAD